MRISFIIPSYNRAYVLAAAIESVLQQPYADCEVVVVDDGSTDSTPEITKQYLDHPKFKTNRFEVNRGQNVARNEGILLASGDIVTIIDSDDESLDTDLRQVVQAFDSNPHLSGIFTGAIARSDGRTMGSMASAGKEFGFEGFVNGTYAGEYQAFLRTRDLPDRIFAEGLGIKRSCTALTWLGLGQHLRFMILDIPTRLYNDSGSDRMGDLGNVLSDSTEIEKCLDLTLEKFGEAILRVAPGYFHTTRSKQSYYALIGRGRRAAIKILLQINPYFASKKYYLSAIIAILIGPRLTISLVKLLKA